MARGEPAKYVILTPMIAGPEIKLTTHSAVDGLGASARRVASLGVEIISNAGTVSTVLSHKEATALYTRLGEWLEEH